MSFLLIFSHHRNRLDFLPSCCKRSVVFAWCIPQQMKSIEVKQFNYIFVSEMEEIQQQKDYKDWLNFHYLLSQSVVLLSFLGKSSFIIPFVRFPNSLLLMLRIVLRFHYCKKFPVINFTAAQRNFKCGKHCIVQTHSSCLGQINLRENM